MSLLESEEPLKGQRAACIYPHPPAVALVLRFWGQNLYTLKRTNLLHLHQDINMPTSAHKHTKNGFHCFETSFFKLKLHLGLVCKPKRKHRTKATPYALQVTQAKVEGFFVCFSCSYLSSEMLYLFSNNSPLDRSPSTTLGPKRGFHDVMCNSKVVMAIGVPMLSSLATRPIT